MEEIRIGNQIWMKSNLNTDKFSNGDSITEIRNNEEWQKAYYNCEPAYCYFVNDPYGEKYGKFYNWHAVNDPRGLAPVGWKIPSEDDWKLLIESLGGTDFAGFKMKEDNSNPNNPALNFQNQYDPFSSLFQEMEKNVNKVGFGAIPLGHKWLGGSFIGYRENCFWWSSSEANDDLAKCLSLNYESGTILFTNLKKGDGLSIRCLSL